MPYIQNKNKTPKKIKNKNKNINKNKRTTRRPRKITLPISPIVIGKIYSNGCGHCIQLAPIWNTMEKQLIKNRKYNFIFKNIEQANEELETTEVNNTYLQNAQNKLELQGGYPTIFKIVNGEVSYYNSERTVAALMNWAMGKMN
jgi:thiol-disulfide isomerase/thioredoxin